MAENTAIRDSLARDRTNMANERTLLAYMRTGLGFILTGAIILRFDPIQLTYTLSSVLIISGVGFIIFGIYRFLTLRKKINSEKR